MLFYSQEAVGVMIGLGIRSPGTGETDPKNASVEAISIDESRAGSPPADRNPARTRSAKTLTSGTRTNPISKSGGALSTR